MSSYRITKYPDLLNSGTVPAMPPLPEYDKANVGKRIVLLRAAKDGMEQTQLASGMGITPQKLNNYEKGRDLIPVHEAVKLCAVTGANFDYLYRGLMDRLPPTLLDALLQAERPSRAG